MLQKFLFLVCILSASTVEAQQKQFDTETDYKQPGAPMPPLRYALYNDTSGVKNKSGKADGDEAMSSGHSHGRKKNRAHEAGNSDSSKIVSKVLTNKDLDNGATLFVMMFNPTCSHCQDETIMLEKNQGLFKKSKIALVATAGMLPYMSDFITFTHVDKYASYMYLGVDSSDFVKDVFLYQSLPQINVYDKGRKLIRTYSGEVAIDSLKKYIE